MYNYQSMCARVPAVDFLGRCCDAAVLDLYDRSTKCGTGEEVGVGKQARNSNAFSSRNGNLHIQNFAI